jgi:hypothetical protein
MPRRDAAAARAVKLDRRHAASGTRMPDNNPSTGMQLLIASVRPSE